MEHRGSDSFLIEITAQVLRSVDTATGAAFVDVVRDEAAQKGTGRWSVEAALALGVPATAMAEAVTARATSGSVDLRAAVRTAMGPPRTSGNSAGLGEPAEAVETVRRALYAAKVVAYAEGLNLIRAASDECDWGVDLAAVAGLWRGGCIIRARLLADIRAAYHRDAALPTLLADPELAARVAEYEPAWRATVAEAVLGGTAAPALSATLASLDALRAPRLPAALIQGQRDLFGAQRRQGCVAMVGSPDVGQQPRADDATAAPQPSNRSKIDAPVVLVAGGPDQVEALGVGDDLRGVERASHRLHGLGRLAESGGAPRGTRRAHRRTDGRPQVDRARGRPRRHGLGHRGGRHAQLERDLDGPAPVPFCAASSRTTSTKAARRGVDAAQHVGGDLDEEGLEAPVFHCRRRPPARAATSRGMRNMSYASAISCISAYSMPLCTIFTKWPAPPGRRRRCMAVLDPCGDRLQDGAIARTPLGLRPA